MRAVDGTDAVLTFILNDGGVLRVTSVEGVPVRSVASLPFLATASGAATVEHLVLAVAGEH